MVQYTINLEQNTFITLTGDSFMAARWVKVISSLSTIWLIALLTCNKHSDWQPSKVNKRSTQSGQSECTARWTGDQSVWNKNGFNKFCYVLKYTNKYKDCCLGFLYLMCWFLVNKSMWPGLSSIMHILRLYTTTVLHFIKMV